jgi:peptidoglycan/xylan/chitin deacetylase (PgdA/CDA1 family)
MRHIILNFHGIGEYSQERELGESSFWISPDTYAAVLDLLHCTRGRVTAEVTFDDGNASDLLIGAEGLARQGRTATFFVLADRIGTRGCLSEQDIATLVRMGHRIGTHGAAHLDWTALDAAGFARELDGARRVIAAAAGQPVRAAALPFGRYNRRVLRELAQRRYEAVYSSDGGPVLSAYLPLPRTSLRSDMTVGAVESLMIGPEPVQRRVRRRLSRLKKRWL